MTAEFSVSELMAAAISRELRDDDFAAVGTASHIPLCGLRLAQRTHAPNLWFLYGGSGALNSKAPELVEMAADFRNLEGAEYRTPLADIIDFEFTGRFTVLFLGGMQIDMHGNMNMVAIGDYARPRVRGPGTVGLAFTGSVQRTFIYVQHHDPRLFVEKVDFVSGRGHSGHDQLQAYRRPWAQGPTYVISPLGVFDFESDDRRMRLRSFHPGQSVASVQAKTGFELAVAADVTATLPPTPEELRLIREIDAGGVLR